MRKALATILLPFLLSGCAKDQTKYSAQAPASGIQESGEVEEVPKPYFALIKDVDWDSGIALSSRDYNNDGFDDIVVGIISSSDTEARLQIYFGDGKGNFTLKRFYDKDIQED